MIRDVMSLGGAVGRARSRRPPTDFFVPDLRACLLFLGQEAGSSSGRE